MRIAKWLLLLFCLGSHSTAGAIVAGGMVAIDRTWPATASGYADRDIYLAVTQEPGNSGYTYWAHQFYFKNGDGGYIGLQQRAGSEKALNFSIWKATGWTAEPDAQCGYFDHEGSGVQCWIPYAWAQGRKYKLRLVNESQARWAAYVTDTASGASRKVATIQVPTAWGGLNETTVEFLENYAQGSDQYASCAQVPATSAVFFRPASANGSVAPTSSTSKNYGNCAAIARSACTDQQDCIAADNKYGTLGSPKVLLNTYSGLCLDTLAGGNRAGLWSCASNNANQSMERDDGFRLLMRNRSQCLQAAGNGEVGLAACDNTSAQRWMPMPGSDGLYNVGSGTCLDPLDNAAQGAYLRVYDCLGNGYQRWKLNP
ncbi:ricin-type beta-trefoil lectin domain protein [Lysobacter sp. BMK333-48F3]|uniref:RICIN domain-containing protein n=1 Tax=Lysobacter sp. BMK333-48F3 TaxID=2867962 RepID=UPI001C8C2D88|nr:ricin-type beta-trefoil lectin domain protein [Lysobacter sp. BMK333-48F3]MBX9403398.1 ricin-type beta-trefoil lectin domain protein [Lysobacter sp. BMK333-48F3]